MVQSGRRFRLAPETLQRLAILSYIFGQELQGNKTVEPGILGLIHHTHPAATDLLNDAIVRDGLVDHSRSFLWPPS